MPFPSHFTHRYSQNPTTEMPFELAMSSRVRARTRVRTHVFVTLFVIVAFLSIGAAASRTSLSADAATAAPPATVTVRGGKWFALGTSVPYLRHDCDFGCGAGGGVAGRAAQVDTLFRAMSRSGVSVVRWELFSSNALQIQRAADGTPTSLNGAVTADMDTAARLAAKHDLSLMFAVLPDPTEVPATWFTEAGQRAALAATLTPLFKRYRHTPSVIGWELVTGADALVDAGRADATQLRATGSELAGALNRTTTSQLALAQPLDATHLDTWVGLGFDAYDPPSIGTSGPTCLTCTTAAALAATEGVDRPIIVGGFATPDAATTLASLRAAATHGYAGALAQTWTGQPGSTTKPQAKIIRNFAYATRKAGPLTRPRNPCLGPHAGTFRCPNLTMSAPRDLSLGHRRGKLVLFSTNALNSMGAGPASIHGVRNGRFTMAGTQLLHRQHGRPLTIRTGAKLLFKAVPGQYRYWKWNGAARMELWRLDATGHPVQLARTGPKTVYCLRDLNRTHGFLRGSPRNRVYPGCNQSLATKQVTLGASVGWTDRYPWTYAENWIDVTGLRGCFAYVHVADPTNVIYESNEDDNRSRVVVKLPFTGSSRGCPGAKALPISGQNGLGY
jgi:hypothetical protein